MDIWGKMQGPLNGSRGGWFQVGCELCLMGLMATGLLAAAATDGQPLSMQRAFAPGEQVHLEMNVGDLRVVRNPDEQELRVVLQPERATDAAKVHSWVRQFEVDSGKARIRLHMPSEGNKGGRVIVYVPDRTALEVDLGVGDLTVDGVQGDKDLNVGVGDLNLLAVRPGEYGHVRNSVGIGDMRDSVFPAKRSGWLGKSEQAQGSGTYRIRAHVGVGDIRYRPARTD
jgi:hypothetical protein